MRSRVQILWTSALPIIILLGRIENLWVEHQESSPLASWGDSSVNSGLGASRNPHVGLRKCVLQLQVAWQPFLNPVFE